MASELLETSTANWGELVGNGKRLIVPPFQRDYAWERDNWDDLWLDLAELRKPGAFSHYMGSVVLQPKDDRTFLLVDGQQRLTTLSLLALAVVHRLHQLADAGEETEENRERAELLQTQFLGAKDPASLVHTWKLRLNRHCNEFYTSQMMRRQFPSTRRLLSAPNRLLLEAYEFFYQKLLDDPELSSSGERLAHFLSNIAALKTLFIQVKVQDEVSAYTVFETLNARGTELSPTDLIKNYIFSMAPDQEGVIEHLEVRWQRIGSLVGLRLLPEFVRHYLTSIRGLTRAEQLFRVIKQQLTSPQEAIDFLDTLVTEAEVYQALQDPESELWESNERLQQALRFLELLSMKQVLPVLLAAYRKTEKKRLAGMAASLAAFLFRFGTVGQRRNNELEGVLAKLAQDLDSRRVINVSGLNKCLQPLYPSDSQFLSDFSTWSVAAHGPKKKLAKFILCELEGLASGTEARYDMASLTLEHILPVSVANDGLENRFGNYALLEKALNREASSAPWPNRRAIYPRSQLHLTRTITAEKWGVEEIEKRQAELAKLAVKLFRMHTDT